MTDDDRTPSPILNELLCAIDQIKAQLPGHPDTQDCPDMECMVCGMRDCPQGEPLHYHHDGCPCCDNPGPD